MLVGKAKVLRDQVLLNFDGVQLTLIDPVKRLEVILDQALLLEKKAMAAAKKAICELHSAQKIA